MPPVWPFKKKKPVDTVIDEAPPAPVVYKRGEDPNARPAVEADSGAYKDALALFGDGSSEVKAATDQSVRYDGATASTESVQPATEEQPSLASPSPSASTHTWVHHTDGYHYKRLEDGSFEPTPHVKHDDGTYAPYS